MAPEIELCRQLLAMNDVLGTTCEHARDQAVATNGEQVVDSLRQLEQQYFCILHQLVVSGLISACTLLGDER